MGVSGWGGALAPPCAHPLQVATLFLATKKWSSTSARPEPGPEGRDSGWQRRGAERRWCQLPSPTLGCQGCLFFVPPRSPSFVFLTCSWLPGPTPARGMCACAREAGARGGRGVLPPRTRKACLYSRCTWRESWGADPRLSLLPRRSPRAAFTYGPLVGIFTARPPPSLILFPPPPVARAQARNEPPRRAQTPAPGLRSVRAREQAQGLQPPSAGRIPARPAPALTSRLLFQEAHLPLEAPTLPNAKSHPQPPTDLCLSLENTHAHTFSSHTRTHAFSRPQIDNPYGASPVAFE